MTNYPIKGQFERDLFHAVDMMYDGSSDALATIDNVYHAGTFEYYIQWGSGPRKGAKGYLQIAPRLPFPMDAIAMKTFVPKWLGCLDNWRPFMKQSAEMGYNMIHFSPLQQRGESNSPYSLFDQLDISDDLFTEAEKGWSKEQKFQKLDSVLKEMEGMGLYAVVDVVWNHTANNSLWLRDHPEAGYNLDNSPHLKAAFALDEAILSFSEQLDQYQLDRNVKDEAALDVMLKVFEEKHLPKHKLWEFFVVNVNKAKNELLQAIEQDVKPRADVASKALAGLDINQKTDILKSQGLYQDPGQGRDSWRIKPEVAIALFHTEIESENEDLLLYYEQALDILNLDNYRALDSDIKSALTNMKGRFVYERFASHGPKNGPVTKEYPLVWSYFTRIVKDGQTHALANNGWIWNADPLQNFAGPNSKAYLRREVIVWGDCVKLRYGDKPSDSPFLWEHMRQYTVKMANSFHGFRIDNCHSTPIPVAQFLLDEARKARPDLYVVAELFTGSEDKDRLFVSKLGINSLIREAIVAWDVGELSRQVHRHGGQPVGSFYVNVENIDLTATSESLEIDGNSPHALFMDCTHDNETPYQKRTAADALPLTALVAFTHCALGSVHGYDQLFPFLLDLVNEPRKYALPGDTVGIEAEKALLLKLHAKMAIEKYTEVYVHQEGQIIRVIRDNPTTHHGYMLIAHTAFKNASTMRPEPIRIRQSSLKLVMGACLSVDTNYEKKSELVGFNSTVLQKEYFDLVAGVDERGDYVDVILKDFVPGTILVFEKILNPVASKNIGELVEDLCIRCPSNDWTFAHAVAELDQALQGTDFYDLNVILYRCDQEERDLFPNHGTYDIPGFGNLAYCGLQGFISVMKWIANENHLGHPICHHLRSGLWAIEYAICRLEMYATLFPNTVPFSKWLRKNLERVKQVPQYLVPKYFFFVIMTAYTASVKRAIALMSPFVQGGDSFCRALALGSIQMTGHVKSTGLEPLKFTPSLAAGLPYFSTGHMRCWGRDIFISLRGMYLVTGRFKDARDHILAFCSVVRHGLVPNLLDSCRRPRYNARDAVWFCLYGIQEYCKMAPEGLSLLDTVFHRRFPTDEFIDEKDPRSYYATMTVMEFIQTVMQAHADGIHFREWNAGPSLDHVMTSQGFQVDVETSWASGLVYGGNPANCGTWMDKMGESVMAGTAGKPATCRDGAAVEIQGLLKATVRWLSEIHESGHYKYKGVTGKEMNIKSFTVNEKDRRIEKTWKEWNDLIQANFERSFYVPINPENDREYDVNPSLIARRGVYKDCFMSSIPYRDYQLRPNLCIAMTVAPELFDKQHALHCLGVMEKVLMGPLGIRTLDPNDWEYRGHYNNNDDGRDGSVAKGFNYHQGPEWVWIVGFFLRAKLIFQGSKSVETSHSIQSLLKFHRVAIKDSMYAGLPELTNQDGKHCPNSCPTQAWSLSCVLDVLFDLEQ